MPIHHPPILLENISPQTQPRASAWAALASGMVFVILGICVALIATRRILPQVEVDTTHRMLLSIGVMPFGVGWILLGAGLRDLYRAARRRRWTWLLPEEPWRHDYPWSAAGASSRSWQDVLRPLSLLWALVFFLFPFHYWAFGPEGVFAVKLFVGIFDVIIALGLLGSLYQGVRIFVYGRQRLRFAQFPFFLGERLRVYLDTPRALKRCRSLTATLRCIQETYVEMNSGEDLEHQTKCEALYSDTLQIPEALWQNDLGPLIIEFPLPYGEYDTTLGRRPPRYWLLTLHGDAPAPTYHAEFLVPVYKRAQS